MIQYQSRKCSFTLPARFPPLALDTIRLPRESFAVPQTGQHNHLALEFTAGYYPRSKLGKKRSQQHRTLRIDRAAIRAAELVPDCVFFARHLVPVIGLCCQKIGVVHLNFITRLDPDQGTRVGGAEDNIIS